MSLHNRALNQQRNNLALNGKPQPLKPLATKSTVLSSIVEKKPLGQGKQNVGDTSKAPGKAVAQVVRVPTLSALRENVPKRQKVLQDMVRTGGKENGFMTYRDRPESVPDIYAEDIGNEALVVAYVEHIYAYLHHREMTIPRNYMDGMSINPRMRAILVDWMVSVMYKFKMCQDTLFLSLNIVDRFLSISELDATKDELQLIGVTAMFIAGKFEEVYPPELEDYVFISDHACTKAQILDCEMMVVNALNFDFTRPSPAHFLRRCCKAAEAGHEEYALAKYITELAQLNIDFVEVKPSLLAASALYLALLFRRGSHNIWNANLTYYSDYEEAPVRQMAGRLCGVVRDAPKLKQQCITKKYSAVKNYEVSVLTESQITSALAHFAN